MEVHAVLVCAAVVSVWVAVVMVALVRDANKCSNDTVYVLV